MLASILDFVHAHSVGMSAVSIAVIDFAIEVCPALKANSIVSLVLGFLKKPAA